MLKKIRDKWNHWRWNRQAAKAVEAVPNTFNREQLENAYKLGYNDGRRDGIDVARKQATKSLKEIIWEKNQTHPKKRS